MKIQALFILFLILNPTPLASARRLSHKHSRSSRPLQPTLGETSTSSMHIGESVRLILTEFFKDIETQNVVADALMNDGITHSHDLIYNDVDEDGMPHLFKAYHKGWFGTEFLHKLNERRKEILYDKASNKQQDLLLGEVDEKHHQVEEMMELLKIAPTLDPDVVDKIVDLQRQVGIPLGERVSSAGEAVERLEEVDGILGKASEQLSTSQDLPIMELIHKKRLMRGTLLRYPPRNMDGISDEVVRVISKKNPKDFFTDPPNPASLSFERMFKSETSSKIALDATTKYGPSFMNAIGGSLGLSMPAIGAAALSVAFQTGQSLDILADVKREKYSEEKLISRLQVYSEPRGAIAMDMADLDLTMTVMEKLIDIANFQDIDKKKADLQRFFRRFGSHICPKVSFGGMIKLKGTLKIKRSTSYTDATAAINLKMARSFGMNGNLGYKVLGGNSSGSKESIDNRSSSLGFGQQAENLSREVVDISEIVGGDYDNASNVFLWRSSLVRNDKWEVIDKHVENCIPIWDFVRYKPTPNATKENLWKEMPKLMFQTWYGTFLNLDALHESGLVSNYIKSSPGMVDLSSRFTTEDREYHEQAIFNSGTWHCCCRKVPSESILGCTLIPQEVIRKKMSLSQKILRRGPSCSAVGRKHEWVGWQVAIHMEKLFQLHNAGRCAVEETSIPPVLRANNPPLYFGSPDGFTNEHDLMQWLASVRKTFQPHLEKLEMCQEKNWCNALGECDVSTGICTCEPAAALDRQGSCSLRKRRRNWVTSVALIGGAVLLGGAALFFAPSVIIKPGLFGSIGGVFGPQIVTQGSLLTSTLFAASAGGLVTAGTMSMAAGSDHDADSLMELTSNGSQTATLLQRLAEIESDGLESLSTMLQKESGVRDLTHTLNHEYIAQQSLLKILRDEKLRSMLVSDFALMVDQLHDQDAITQLVGDLMADKSRGPQKSVALDALAELVMEQTSRDALSSMTHRLITFLNDRASLAMLEHGLDKQMKAEASLMRMSIADDSVARLTQETRSRIVQARSTPARMVDLSEDMLSSKALPLVAHISADLHDWAAEVHAI